MNNSRILRPQGSVPTLNRVPQGSVQAENRVPQGSVQAANCDNGDPYWMTLVNENETYNTDGDRVGTVIIVDGGKFGQLIALGKFNH